MFKKIFITLVVLFSSSCVYFGEWFFNAKNPGYYFYSLVRIMNNEIEIRKNGIEEYYGLVNRREMVKRYIDVLPKESQRYWSIRRGDLTIEEFHYYVPSIISNLKGTQYYNKFDKTKITLSNGNYSTFFYKLEFNFKTIGEKGDKIKLIYIDDNKAHIYVP